MNVDVGYQIGGSVPKAKRPSQRYQGLPVAAHDILGHPQTVITFPARVPTGDLQGRLQGPCRLSLTHEPVPEPPQLGDPYPRRKYEVPTRCRPGTRHAPRTIGSHRITRTSSCSPARPFIAARNPSCRPPASASSRRAPGSSASARVSTISPPAASPCARAAVFTVVPK